MGPRHSFGQVIPPILGVAGHADLKYSFECSNWWADGPICVAE